MNNFEIELTAQDIEDWKNQFTDRESYFKWIKDWRAVYKKLSNEIKQMKVARKPFIYEYREKSDQQSKKRVKVGANPNFNRFIDEKLSYKREAAREMMRERVTAKWVSRIMRETKVKKVA